MCEWPLPVAVTLTIRRDTSRMITSATIQEDSIGLVSYCTAKFNHSATRARLASVGREPGWRWQSNNPRHAGACLRRTMFRTRTGPAMSGRHHAACRRGAMFPGRRRAFRVAVRREVANDAHRKHHPTRASRAVMKSRPEHASRSGFRTPAHGGKLRGGQRLSVWTQGPAPPSASARGPCGSAALRTTATAYAPGSAEWLAMDCPPGGTAATRPPGHNRRGKRVRPGFGGKWKKS